MQQAIAVLGAGSWGTALAIVLANNHNAVRLWGRDASHMRDMAKSRMNSRYLPNAILPENLVIFEDLSQCLAGLTDILIVVPSDGFRGLLALIKPYLSAHTRLVWGTKGLDAADIWLDTVVTAVLGRTLPMAALSGPSLAVEVAAGLPTAVSLASLDDQFASDLTARFHHSNFRVYKTRDMRGVELCGAVKNVLAIATGISDGLALGSNARCALITRGLAEMGRLCQAVGGLPDTLMGLAGLGDLVLTCTDDRSRNRRFGLALGSGQETAMARASVNQAVEGFYNVKQVYQLARAKKVDMPIAEQVYRIVYDHLAPALAVKELLGRSPKFEKN